MRTLGERVRYRRTQLKLTQVELAKRAGSLSQTTIANIESGRNESTTELVALAKGLECRPEWLNHGEEPIEETTAGGDALGGKYEYVTKVSGVILSAGAGKLVFEHEEIDRSHVFRAEWMRKRGLRASACKIFEVEGESMYPYLRSGDVVLVNTDDRRIRSGEVYAIAVGNEHRIKRIIQRSDGALEIRSDNESPEHPVEIVRGADMDRINILGIVVWRGG